MEHHAHGFVDGAYLRSVSESAAEPLANPHGLVKLIARSTQARGWPESSGPSSVGLSRVTYYDARPDEPVTELHEYLQSYWKEVELLPDTHLGFGSLRSEGTSRRAPRQKGVDTLIAVDMLTGAFDRLFAIAILVAGDADFVPVVHEVQRRGSMVLVAFEPQSGSDDLRRAADRFYEIRPSQTGNTYPLLDAKRWPTARPQTPPH